jgi:hypothetical protein
MLAVCKHAPLVCAVDDTDYCSVKNAMPGSWCVWASVPNWARSLGLAFPIGSHGQKIYTVDPKLPDMVVDSH